MWRNTTPLVCRHILKQPHRCSRGASTSGGGSGVAKALLWTTSAVAIGAGGAVGYAWYDPDFRRSVESNVPQSKDVLHRVLGEPRKVESAGIDMPSMKQIGDKISAAAASIMPAKKEQKNEAQNVGVPAPKSKMAVPSEKPSPPPTTTVTPGSAIDQKPATKEQLPTAGASKADAAVSELGKFSAGTKDFEDELRNQLRRQAAAHSENLEDALRVQRTQLESKSKRDVDEALRKQRDNFDVEVGSAIGRLNAIETALEGRAEQDRENRRAKQLWLACQQLKKAVLHGRAEGTDYTARKQPLVAEIAAIKEAGTADPFVKALLNSVKSETVKEGVYTQEDLINRFHKVRKICRRTALVGDSGGTLLQYFLSMVQSWFIFDRVKLEPSELAQIDPSDVDTIGILIRAAYFVDQLQFASAIRLMLLLEGEPARVASDWIKDARLHLETRRAAELLLAHASAVSMRTIY